MNSFRLLVLTLIFSPINMISATHPFEETLNMQSHTIRDSELIRECHAGNKAAVKRLLQNSAQPNAQDRYGNTALHVAAQNHDPKLVKIILNAGAHVDALNNQGLTPLLYTCKHTGHFAVAEVLLNYGANTQARDTDGNTPLLWATKREYLSTIKHLLQSKRVGITATNNDGQSALDCSDGLNGAIQRNCIEQARKGNTRFSNMQYTSMRKKVKSD